jgi:hypothetical protein
MATSDIHAALVAAEWAALGSWPVAGGWLDQTQVCLDAIGLIRAEQAGWRVRATSGRGEA